jgi:hypothetical protein
MRAKLLIAAALVIGTAAFAQGAATTTADAPPTLSAAKKANYLVMADRKGGDIYMVDAGANDSVAFVEVIYDNRIIKVPGSTISTTEKSRVLKTSLTGKEVAKLN